MYSEVVNYMKDNCKAARGIFTVLFVIIVIAYSAANFFVNKDALWEVVRDDLLVENAESLEVQTLIKNLETAIEEELLYREPLVEAYAALHMVFGKHEDNSFDTIQGKDGVLYNGNFWRGYGDDQKELAVRTRRLHDSLAEKGTQMGVVIYPMKTPVAENQYFGLPYDSYEEVADEYLMWLRYYGVPYLDLFDLCEAEGMSVEDAFFSSDHHWRAEAAFEGYVRIVDWMNETFQADLDPDNVLRNQESYLREVHEDVMLGSEGRKTGVLFAGGLEDVTLIYPREEGSYTLEEGDIGAYNVHEGSFCDALLDVEKLEEARKDIYGGYAERVYLHQSVSQYASITNHEASSESTILFLRDSFSTPIGAFMAQSFSQLDMLWLLELSEEELEIFLEKNHYDYVLIALYPNNLMQDAFVFGTTEEE